MRNYFFIFLIFITQTFFGQFSVSSNIIRVTSNATLTDFQNWANSNSSHALVRSDHVVEALKQIKVNNGVEFNTSNGTLIINHRLEGENNNNNDSGIWKVHGGVVIVEGSGSFYSEYWATADFEDATFICRKSNGAISFWRSQGDSKVKNTKFIVKTAGFIDSHLQLLNGGQNGAFLDGFEIHNELTSGSNFLLLRDTDTENAKLFNVNLGGWSSLSQPTTFHKNMEFEKASDEIDFFYRRNNSPVFYNVTNRLTGNKIFTIAYKNPGTNGGTGRGIIVGKLEPIIRDKNNNRIEDVEIEVRRVSDQALETTGVTNSNGTITITNGSGNSKFQSLNWNGRTIYETGIKYIKQAITPTNSGVVNSVNQGDFRIRFRHPEYQLFEVTQSFENDFTGEIILTEDDLFNTSISNANAITGINFNSTTSTITISENRTLQDLYNYYKVWISDANNMNVNPFITNSGDVLNIGAYNLVINENARLESSNNFSKVITTGVATIGTNADIANNLFIALTDNSNTYKLIELKNLLSADGEIRDFTNTSFPNGELLTSFTGLNGTYRFVTTSSSTQIKIEVFKDGFSNWVVNPLDVSTDDVYSYIVIQGEDGNPATLENQETQLYLLKKILVLSEAYRSSYGELPADLQVTLNQVTTGTKANAEYQEDQIALLKQVLVRLTAQIER